MGKKKDHDLPVGSLSEMQVLPYLIGDGVTLRRSGPAIELPLGLKGLTFTIPEGVEILIRKDGSGYVAEILAGQPFIKLPVLRNLYPVKVEKLRLIHNLLTVELDGWRDYTIRIE